MISDEQIKKVVEECVKDPETGHIFRHLFIMIAVMDEEMKINSDDHGCPLCHGKLTTKEFTYDNGSHIIECINETCGVIFKRSDDQSYEGTHYIINKKRYIIVKDEVGENLCTKCGGVILSQCIDCGKSE